MQRSTFKLFMLRHGQSELNHENIFCGWIDAHITSKGREQARKAAELIKTHCESHGISLPQIGYNSRLVRTHETMEAMMSTFQLDPDYHVTVNSETSRMAITDAIRRHKVPVLASWRLNERHYGLWQGLRKPEVLKQVGQEEYQFVRRDYRGKPPQAAAGAEETTAARFREPKRSEKYRAELEAAVELPYSESLCDVEKRLTSLIDDIAGSLGSTGDSALVVGHGSSIRAIIKILEGISEQDIKDIDIPNGIPMVVELDRSDRAFVRRYYLDPALGNRDGKP